MGPLRRHHTALYRPPFSLPSPDATPLNVNRREPLTLQHRSRKPTPFAPLANRRQRPIARQLLEPPRQLSVGDVERAGDVAGGVLVGSAHVEDQRRVFAIQQLGESLGPDRFDPCYRALLRPPGAHAATEEATHP